MKRPEDIGAGRHLKLEPVQYSVSFTFPNRGLNHDLLAYSDYVVRCAIFQIEPMTWKMFLKSRKKEIK